MSKIRMSAEPCSLCRPWRRILSATSRFCGFWNSLVFGSITPVSASLFTWLSSLTLYVFFFSVWPVRPLIIEFSPHPNLGWLHLKILVWIIFTCVRHSIVSNSLWPHGLQPTRLLCPWDYPGKNTGVGSHLILRGMFLIQGSNPELLWLLHWQADSLPLSHLERPSLALLSAIYVAGPVLCNSQKQMCSVPTVTLEIGAVTPLF